MASLFFCAVEVATTSEKPKGGDVEVVDEVCEPCDLKDVAVWFFFEGVHVPAVYSVQVCEGLFSTDFAVGFKAVERLEETFYYLLAVGGLHYWLLFRGYEQCAIHCLKGSAFGEGMDWIRRNICCWVAASVNRILPSAASIFNR